MKEIKEIEIEQEKIHLKKGFLGWTVVYPIKINNKINWKNFIAGGNWWNLIIILFLVLLILGCVYEYSLALQSLNECMDKPNIINIIT